MRIRSRTRILLLLGSVQVFMVGCAMIYMIGMSNLEGKPRSFLESLAWAAETLTTTGYGKDAGWNHPGMVLFVIFIQFIGVGLVFLIVPVYLIPMLEERFEMKLPKTVGKLKDHVIVYRYGPAVATLVRELEQAQIHTVIVEQEENTARKIQERKWRVVYGDLEAGVLENANLLQAQALIANGTDDGNAALTLAARQLGFQGDILAMIEDPLHRNPLMLAGATACYTPKHILGAALAVRASSRLSPRIAGMQQVGRVLQMGEIRVDPGSSLAGRTLAEAGIGRKTGATVIAQWVEGFLQVSPKADTVLQAKGILVVVGTKNSIERLAEQAGGRKPLPRRGPFLVHGRGEVAEKVAELLTAVGEDVRIMGGERDTGYEILDNPILEKMGVTEAQAVILALASDSATLFDTVVIKDYAPHTPVIARVNQTENVERIYRAGADFALSISDVSGQILARKLLGEESYAIGPVLKLQRTKVGTLVGSHPAELKIRDRTGCSVVAVERGKEVVRHFGNEFRFEPEDRVYVCGDRTSLHHFSNFYRASVHG